jgi:hypothetical protein
MWVNTGGGCCNVIVSSAHVSEKSQVITSCCLNVNHTNYELNLLAGEALGAGCLGANKIPHKT